jgi:hypothetical protein
MPQRGDSRDGPAPKASRRRAFVATPPRKVTWTTMSRGGPAQLVAEAQAGKVRRGELTGEERLGLFRGLLHRALAAAAHRKTRPAHPYTALYTLARAPVYT